MERVEELAPARLIKMMMGREMSEIYPYEA